MQGFKRKQTGGKFKASYEKKKKKKIATSFSKYFDLLDSPGMFSNSILIACFYHKK